MITLTGPAQGDQRTATLRRLTWLLDDAIPLPLGFRMGLDALIGLVPGLGDLVGGAAALYGIGVAWRLGAPGVVLTRMVMNAAIDSLIGAVPILGDLWYVGFASHRRNLAILEHWLEVPHVATKRSKWVLVGAVAALVVALLVAFASAVWLVFWLAGKISA